jgi:hypothetical protein
MKYQESRIGMMAAHHPFFHRVRRSMGRMAGAAAMSVWLLLPLFPVLGALLSWRLGLL